MSKTNEYSTVNSIVDKVNKVVKELYDSKIQCDNIINAVNFYEKTGYIDKLKEEIYNHIKYLEKNFPDSNIYKKFMNEECLEKVDKIKNAKNNLKEIYREILYLPWKNKDVNIKESILPGHCVASLVPMKKGEYTEIIRNALKDIDVPKGFTVVIGNLSPILTVTVIMDNIVQISKWITEMDGWENIVEYDMRQFMKAKEILDEVIEKTGEYFVGNNMWDKNVRL